jgi:hypothetical protein
LFYITLKKATEKRAGGVAQAAQCLPSKYKALSSNPRTAKKKKATEKHFDKKDKIIYRRPCHKSFVTNFPSSFQTSAEASLTLSFPNTQGPGPTWWRRAPPACSDWPGLTTGQQVAAASQF